MPRCFNQTGRKTFGDVQSYPLLGLSTFTLHRNAVLASYLRLQSSEDAGRDQKDHDRPQHAPEGVAADQRLSERAVLPLPRF